MLNEHFESHPDFSKLKQSYQTIGHLLGKLFKKHSWDINQLDQKVAHFIPQWHFWDGLFKGSHFPAWHFWNSTKFYFKYTIHDFKLRPILIQERNKLWLYIRSLYESFFESFLASYPPEKHNELRQYFRKKYIYAYKDAREIMAEELYATI